MREKLGKAEYIKFDNAGHALGNQVADKVNEILVRVIEEGVKAAENGA